MIIFYWILSFAIGLLPAYLVYKKDQKKEIPLKWLPAFLRYTTISLTALLLLAPVFSNSNYQEEKPIILWLQDASTSTRTSLGNFKDQYQKDVATVCEKLEKKYIVKKIAFGQKNIADSIFNYNQRSTNISGAIEQIAEQYYDKNIGAVIVASDGIFNEGSNPLFLQLPKPLHIYTVALGDSTTPADIVVKNINANKSVTLNSTFEITADIGATQLSGNNAAASLSNNGHTIATNTTAITNNDFATTATFKTKATQKGLQQFTISIPQTGKEKNIRNNTQSVFVNVTEDQSKILLLANAPHPDIATIKNALDDIAQYKLTIVTDGKTPSNMNDYDILIAYQYSPKNSIVTLPTWYILGRNSNFAELNNISRTLKISGTNTTTDILPILNNNFNLFAFPQNIQQVLPKLPPLSSTAANIDFETKEATLFYAGHNNSSLWAFYPNTTPISVLKGEGIWRWGMYEYKNFHSREMTNTLIRQCINFLQVKKEKNTFKVYMNKYDLNDNETPIIFAEWYNASGELINTAEATLHLKGPNESNYQYVFEKIGNSYRLNTGLLGSGKYTFKGSVNYNGKTYEAGGYFNVSDIPIEQLRTHADYNLLFQLAQKNNGIFFTQYNFKNITDSIMHNKNITTVLHEKNEDNPLINHRWVFFVILLLASLEWFLRKYWGMM